MTVQTNEGKKSPAMRMALWAALALAVLGGGASAAPVETVLYSFCSRLNCTDGANPAGGVIADRQGKLFGTTGSGGPSTFGTAFTLSPSGIEKVFYTFTGTDLSFFPNSGLTANKGNFYGTTRSSFMVDIQQLYKLSPSGSFTVLQEIGENFFSPLIAHNGDVFGTTYAGGNCNFARGCGTIFRLSPDGTLTQLYAFCASSFACSGGSHPTTGLYADKTGNLYGTTSGGGAFRHGVIFKLSPRGTYSVLYSFKTRDGSPSSALIADAMGDLYGTTGSGGATNLGTVFKLRLDGRFIVLHSFKGRDGANPQASLIVDSKDQIFGTTNGGGTFDRGTAYRLSPGGAHTVLHSFCSLASCSDGADPSSGLTADTDGHLFGTTSSGGANGFGTVFKLTGTGFVPEEPPAR